MHVPVRSHSNGTRRGNAVGRKNSKRKGREAPPAANWNNGEGG